jgi:hypothetical protein
MSKVSKAVCNKDSLGVWTVMTDCLLRGGGETPFPLRGWGAIIKEYNVKTKNKRVIG